MEFNIYIFNLVLLIIISLGLFLTIIYILLPWFFNLFVSPKFNATYVFNSKDFKKKEKLKQLPYQNRIAQVNFNKNQGTYSILFGTKRELIDGIIKIRHEFNEYINKNSSDTQLKMLKLTSINESDGIDKLGVFKSLELKYKLEDEERYLDTSIKHYNNQDFITFELSFPDGLKNTSSGEFSEMITKFPSFINQSLKTKIFTFRNTIFCPPSRTVGTTSAPVLFYDDDLNCFILSPLDGFLNTIISKDKNNRIMCGIQGNIKEIPKEFSQKFILLFGKGINQSMERLGGILLKYHNSKRKSLYANIITSYLGFWTDCGGYYYYKKEKGLNYEDTMVAIKEYFDDKKIPIRYYNFDSWWYLKHTNKIFTDLFRPLVRLMGGGLYGNILRWEVDPKNFTTDLKTFNRERFQKPITAHSRRWDARSPYVKKFEFETYKHHAVPIKKEFWDWLMTHAKESGIEVYEQDWMKNQIVSMPILRTNFKAQREWLISMATAAKEQGIDIFYCMQTPGILLYSIKHSNVNISRCSGDYNHRWPLTYRFIHSTQTNILFNAIGINSHPDVFRSRTMENVKLRPFGEKYPNLNCLYQILNAGIVAPGDKKENVNWPLLQKTCRDDGLLLKPDKSLTANDLMFKKHKKYYICDTYTKTNNLTWRYILITNIWPRRVKETSFTLEELGLEKKDYVIYDFHSGIVNRIKFDDSIEVGRLRRYNYKYYVICAILLNGMALIGCPDKFITCSRKLITQVNTNKNSLSFLVENIKNTVVKILIYSEQRPSSIQVENKLIDSWKYNEEINLIELNLEFEKFSPKEVLINK
ncbi:MAG: hypothetical protein ACFE9Q_00760 [Candidatus Hodarchaeota archaeon]